MSRLGQAAPGTVDSPTVIDGGIAGGSALQQASQRRATADRLIAEARWLEALAADEQAMAAHLAELPPAYAVLHDLRLPGSKGNIDHVVIGPGGAFVVLTRRCSEAVVLRDGGLWAGDQSLSDVFNAARVESQLLTQSLLTPVVPVVALLDTRLPAATPGSLEGVLVCSGDRVVRVITRGSHTLLPPHLVGEVAERALPLLHNPGSVPRTESALGVRADPAPDTSVRPVVPPAVVWQRQGGGQGPATPKSTAASSAVPTRDPTPPTNESTGRARAFRFVAVALTLLCLIALAVGSLISFVWSGDEAADTSSPSQAVQSTSAPDSVVAPGGTGAASLAAPKVEFAATCSAPGAGWQFRPVWPGDLPGLSRYEVETQSLDGSWSQLPPLESSDSAWDALTGQPAGAAYTMRITAVLADGSRSPSTPTVVVTPSAAC